MKLRPYQSGAVNGTFEAWKTHQAALGVLPTGCGKTIVFAHVIERVLREQPGMRAMVLAHREELITQGAEKIEAVTGARPDVEMAESVAKVDLFGKRRVVVSSIQTQCAGESGAGRMTRFDPAEFALLVIDEAHHATAASYRRVLAHYLANPALRVLGVTATPDRADEAALGKVFGAVAFDYELPAAIHDGWLVPVFQRAVVVEDLDYSTMRTTAGDLNGADLAAVMEHESALHGIAGPTIELAGDRKTLIFAASVAHAERLCEILCRHRQGCGRWVCGATPKDERRQMFADYADGKFQFLVNVDVATEGFDEPGVQVVVMAKPTKSRSKYAQMAGRGTRPARDIAHELNDVADAEARRSMIAASSKACVEIIDFVGNSGAHKLVTTADILGGDMDDAVVERAKKIAEAAGGGPVDAAASLEEAERQLAEERERARRAAVRVGAKYSSQTVDPFDVLNVQPWRERGWDKDRQPSQKMLDLLDRFGIKTDGLSWTKAKQLIGTLLGRREKGLCTFKQAKILTQHGYDGNVSFDVARQILDTIFHHGGGKRGSQEVAATTSQGGKAGGSDSRAPSQPAASPKKAIRVY